MRIYIGILGILGTLGMGASAVAADAPNPSKGPELYQRYCASCHGKEGKGNGPVAAALKVKPTDLTQLSKSRGGKFPVGLMRQLLGGGSSTPAHGSDEMPIWGPVFRAMSPDEAIAKLRVDNLLRYLETIQQK